MAYNQEFVNHISLTPKHKPQYHYDIGYGGLFAHYRSTEPPKFEEKDVIACLMSLRLYFDQDKKGITLDNVAHMTGRLQELRDMGFYLVNFETKDMAVAISSSDLLMSSNCERSDLTFGSDCSMVTC